MKIKILIHLCLLSLLLATGQSFSQPVIILNNSISLMDIGKQMKIFEDKTANLRLNQILTPEYQSRFVQCNMAIPNLGTSQKVLWCRLELQNKSDHSWFLRVENAYLDTIQMFIHDGAGYLKKESGKNYLFDAREIKTANFIFPINLPKDSAVTIYIRVKHHMIYFPLQVGQFKPIIEAETWYNYYYGAFFGIVGIILIANFIMYFSIRDISLIWYLCYTGSVGLYTLVTKGYFIQLLPDSILWLNQYSPIVVYTAGIFVPLFGISFLKVKKAPPLFYECNIGLTMLGVIAMAVFLAKNFALSSTLIQIFSVSAAVVMIVYGIIFYITGFKPARFFIIAYSFSIVSITINTLQFQGFIPVSFFSQNALQLGTLWEIIFFTIAIGDKTNLIRKDKVKAQKEVLTSSQENEFLLQNQNIILEQKVTTRTHELEVEKRKSDDLLLNILPAEIAEEMKQNGHSRAKTFSMVTVMFIDFKDFTAISEKVSAELLVSEIDYCFCAFDNILQKHRVEKIKTVGDAYICAGGMPVLTFTHAADTLDAAIEIRNFMLDRKQEKESRNEIPFELRIGIHTGPVVAGVVGVKKFAYDIWGDTVNIAARMEQSSEPGKINISGSTYQLVKDRYACTHRGRIQAKNKGEIDMYFVENYSQLPV